MALPDNQELAAREATRSTFLGSEYDRVGSGAVLRDGTVSVVVPLRREPRLRRPPTADPAWARPAEEVADANFERCSELAEALHRQVFVTALDARDIRHRDAQRLGEFGLSQAACATNLGYATAERAKQRVASASHRPTLD
jgi:hypothetical protein